MRDVHYVLHAPQGDTYADLLFTMIERLHAPAAGHLHHLSGPRSGRGHRGLFQRAAADAYERFQPKALLVGASCTAELIQDDPGGLARALRLPIPIVPLELPAYQKKENWGAAETFYQLVRTMASREAPPPGSSDRHARPMSGRAAISWGRARSVSAIATTCSPSRRSSSQLGVDINVVAPLGATPADLARLGEADFNVVLYPEIAGQAAQWLCRIFDQPVIKAIPLGHAATREFIDEVARTAGVDPGPALAGTPAHSRWYARSVDSTYLTGKSVFVFGDATHAVAAARIAAEELGFTVVGLGTYSREFARDVREAARKYGLEALITDDYLEVEARVAELQPELVLGTQMERHIAKRLGIPCAVISAPVHVQDFPARYSPQMGFEGANVIFDTWVHPLMMGLEEHLLTMFRDDFEFHDGAAPSHLGDRRRAARPRPRGARRTAGRAAPAAALGSGRREGARKIPFFVRGKARRNTERFAAERSLS